GRWVERYLCVIVCYLVLGPYSTFILALNSRAATLYVRHRHESRSCNHPQPCLALEVVRFLRPRGTPPATYLLPIYRPTNHEPSRGIPPFSFYRFRLQGKRCARFCWCY
ncbi:unnamed protein product, partial [Ectocarpus sp. 4 AP-2014]